MEGGGGLGLSRQGSCGWRDSWTAAAALQLGLHTALQSSLPPPTYRTPSPKQGRFLNTPELVPFRLTRDVVDGMGVTGVEGVMRRCCEETLRVRSCCAVIVCVFRGAARAASSNAQASHERHSSTAPLPSQPTHPLPPISGAACQQGEPADCDRGVHP